MNQKETAPTVAFHQHGEEFYIAKKGTGIIHMELPAGTYELQYHMEKGFYLDRVKDMRLPKRTYGDVSSFANRVMRRFDVGTENLGVMLIGRKGSGKTLTLKKLAELSIQMTMPVILVQRAYTGLGMDTYLSHFEQPLMVAVDEFDKLFAPTKEDVPAAPPGSPSFGPSHPATQNEIITLLQGTMGGGKKLYVFTANAAANVSEYLKNRPGRIRYTKAHGALEIETIIEYAKEHLANKSEGSIASLLTVSRQVPDFNFDLMQAIVEDMNLYKEDAYEASRLIVSSHGYCHDTYVLETRKDGELLFEDAVNANYLGSPRFSMTAGYRLKDSMEVLHTVDLTHENFKGFGESPLDVHYEKDGLEFRFLFSQPATERFVPGADTSFTMPPKRSEREKRLDDIYLRNRRFREAQEKKEAEAMAGQVTATPNNPPPSGALVWPPIGVPTNFPRMYGPGPGKGTPAARRKLNQSGLSGMHALAGDPTKW